MCALVQLIGDSFGTPRGTGADCDVPADQTWPRQVQHALPDDLVAADFRPFRKLTECPELLADAAGCRLAIVQAGIVDCYPRPLPQSLSRSPSLACKLLRRGIRPVRRAWVNYLYVTTWSTETELVTAVTTILNQSPQRMTGFVTAAPLLREHALHTPGAQEAVFAFNDLLRETVSGFPQGFVIDLHTALLAQGHRRFLSPQDSHLNQAGNDWLAAAVRNEIALRLGIAVRSERAAA